MNDIRARFKKLGLIHDGPPTYGPNHFCPAGGNGRKCSVDELDRRGFVVAASAKRNRLLGVAGEVPAYFYNQ